MTSNKGHTIAELIVYMVLGLIVTGFALNAISHMAKNYVHGREITKIQANGRDAINAMSRDLANTGFKYYIEKVGTAPAVFNVRPTETSSDSLFLLGSYTGRRVHLVGVLPADASFYHWNATPYDSIEVFRCNLATTNSLASVERIKYKVIGTTLYRVSRTCTNRTLVSGNIDWTGAYDSTAIVENVQGIQYQFSTDGLDWASHDNPTGDADRHLMKHIKVSLLVSSERDASIGKSTKTETVGSVSVTRDGQHLYRSYEGVISIPNNGIVQ